MQRMLIADSHGGIALASMPFSLARGFLAASCLWPETFLELLVPVFIEICPIFCTMLAVYSNARLLGRFRLVSGHQAFSPTSQMVLVLIPFPDKGNV
jgi:hypothetical protein